MYSFFGKGFVAPKGAPPIITDDEDRPRTPGRPTAPPPGEIERRLRILRARIAERRHGEQERIRRVQETHRKQAAYGRDTRQVRPKHAGYATEAEKIMGGGTGYHARPPMGEYTMSGLGDTTEEVDQAAVELQEAVDLVKQITKEVKVGTAPKSELEKAIVDLRRKVAITKSVAKELSGYGEAKTTKISLAALVAIGFILWYLRSKS